MQWPPIGQLTPQCFGSQSLVESGRLKTGHNSSFDPSPHKLGNLYIKGVLLFDMTRQHFIKLTHLLVFPQLRNVYETVFDQLLQQQSYQTDNKNIFQPFDKAYVTARVDTGRARVPAPIELNTTLPKEKSTCSPSWSRP